MEFLRIFGAIRSILFFWCGKWVAISSHGGFVQDLITTSPVIAPGKTPKVQKSFWLFKVLFDAESLIYHIKNQKAVEEEVKAACAV